MLVLEVVPELELLSDQRKGNPLDFFWSDLEDKIPDDVEGVVMAAGEDRRYSPQDLARLGEVDAFIISAEPVTNVIGRGRAGASGPALPSSSPPVARARSTRAANSFTARLSTDGVRGGRMGRALGVAAASSTRPVPFGTSSVIVGL